ncbi:MFS transporter [Shewanella frigidimarina]|uniref:MFS transporter n=1 Tax=Shewanella frigidimarina TaxID=56812 RepID=A0A125BEB6_SHEFR|nr:MFS transporter [Shewanella frigidimarina]KVX01284.1 MFS transporter [Shewanella frigidimarina]
MIVKRHSVIFCALVVAIGGFIFGLDAALISGTIRYITVEFNLSDLQVGAVVSAPGFGVIFALMVTGYTCDRFGRKNTLLIISFIYVFSAVASVLATSFEELFISRFIGGLAFTSLSVAAMYIGEIAPSHLRGKLVSMIQINIVIGLSLAFFANYGLLLLSQSGLQWVVTLGIDSNIWRWMLGVEILPAIAWFVLLMFIPKSPRWLMMRNSDDKALTVLTQFVGADKAQKELNNIKQSLISHDQKQSFFVLFKSLFETRLRKVMVIALTIALVQQITGINAIMFYAPTIFEQLGVGTNAAFLQALVLGIVSIVFTFVAVFLIDRVGRRPLMIWGLALATVSLFACYWGFEQATYRLSADAIANLGVPDISILLANMTDITYSSDVEFKNALIDALGTKNAKMHEGILFQHAANMNAMLISVGIISFIAAFHFSLGPVMWVIFSEIFPTQIRGVAIPFFAFIASIMSYLIQQFFPWQLSHFGAADIFLSYATCGVIGFLLLFKLMPETKNKSIEEIAELLSTPETPELVAKREI